MSYTKEVTLWCDHHECSRWVQLNSYESRGGRVTRARIYARLDGWTFQYGEDLCKEHSTIKQKASDDPLFDGPLVTLEALRANG